MSKLPGPLAGKTALITGAAKRLGRATALSLATAGARVVVHYYRSAREAATLIDEIRRSGQDAWTIPADLADPNQIAPLFEQAVQHAGPLDILINNASIFPTDRLDEVSLDRLQQNAQIHAYTPLMLARHFVGQNRPGHIINLLDSRITDYDQQHAAYHLSKRMLFTLTRMLAVEFAPRIVVNAVAPGLILAPAGKDDTYLQKLAHTNPLHRHGAEGDITNAILFLLTSRFITGQVIYIDGGRHLKGQIYGG